MAISKPVSFKEKEEDLIEYIKDKDFSYYVKGLIRADMEKGKNTQQSGRKKNMDFEF